MALFVRKPKDSVLPEVDQYYEGERRDRAGLAWLLALVSVAVVALVIIGVFLAGRWAYRQIANNDDNGSEVTISDNSGENDLTFDGGAGTDEGTNEDGSNASDSQNEGSTEGDQQANNQTGSEIPAASEGEESTSSADENEEATTVPTTGGDESTEELPSTGPASMGAAFALVSTAAGAAHYVVTRKRAEQ